MPAITSRETSGINPQNPLKDVFKSLYLSTSQFGPHFYGKKFFKSKLPSAEGDGNRWPPSWISREEAMRFAEEAYEKAVKDGRELFGASLKIDGKIKEATKQIEKHLGWYVGVLSFAVALGVPLLLWHTAELVEKRFPKDLPKMRFRNDWRTIRTRRWSRCLPKASARQRNA